MQTLEGIFVKEFNQMMLQRKAVSGTPSISSVPVPVFISLPKLNSVYIKGINEDYYSFLNCEICTLLGRQKLLRRKYDYTGGFISDGESDGYKVEDVVVPQGSVAIASNVRIGVPTKFVSKGFDYVDYVEKKNSDSKKYIYIIPKEYCYLVNQSALVISWNKLTRIYYKGFKVALTSGNNLFVYVIPYKPTSMILSYRVLKVGLDPNDLDVDLKSLISFWKEMRYIFDPNICVLFEGSTGKSNLAYDILNGGLEYYEKYDLNKSLSKDSDLDIYDEI